MTDLLDQLETEQRNLDTMHIDEMNTLDMISMMNHEDKKVAFAVEKQLPMIAQAIDCIDEQMRQGGRLLYIGAGTSGRLGVLDASECPPTFGVDNTLVHGIIAGGHAALTTAIEGAEDSVDDAKSALQAIALNSNDVVCGLASSGKTPFVIGGLEYAKEMGCQTISICCVSNAMISSIADFPIETMTGAEALTGSTRLKAGTAQKMVLNMLTTCAMIKRGKVYSNLMVDVQPTNAKLKQRAIGIVMTSIDCTQEVAIKLLDETNYSVKKAILVGLTGLNQEECQKILDDNHQHVSNAIKSVKNKVSSC